MRSRKSVPLHLRLVLVNGVVFAAGVLAMSLAPEDERGPMALLVLGVGLVAIVAVNTRHLRQSLTPLLSTLGVLRHHWQHEHRTRTARSLATQEYDAHRMAGQLHDKVGAHLAATLVSLKRAIDHAPPELAEELRAVQHDAQNTFVEVRRITRRLRPETLEDLGLHSALGFLLGVGVGGNGARGGILGMRERAALVGGRLEVTDRPGGGTQVRLEVPAHPVGTR